VPLDNDVKNCDGTTSFTITEFCVQRANLISNALKFLGELRGQHCRCRDIRSHFQLGIVHQSASKLEELQGPRSRTTIRERSRNSYCSQAGRTARSGIGYLEYARVIGSLDKEILDNARKEHGEYQKSIKGIETLERSCKNPGGHHQSYRHRSSRKTLCERYLKTAGMSRGNKV
jgi:hypothetical protein